MKSRLMLSALAGNYRPRPVPGIPVNTDVIFEKQWLNWRLRNRTQVRHNRLPMLMSHIIHVVMGKVTLPLITLPTGVAWSGQMCQNRVRKICGLHGSIVLYISQAYESKVISLVLLSKRGQGTLSWLGGWCMLAVLYEHSGPTCCEPTSKLPIDSPPEQPEINVFR